MEKNFGEIIAKKIVDGINNALAEIDELKVQLALGKAEAKDLYEINKKKFLSNIHEMENQFRELKKDETILPIVNAMESLRVQLALGKAETKELFEEQYTKINQALHQLESELKNNQTISENYARFNLELEKFKIKMNLFALHYKLTKITMLYDYELKKKELSEKLNKFNQQMISKQKEGLERWENFQDEIKEAYHHFKSAFKQ